MTSGRQAPQPTERASYAEALAQWRLDVRTEVKRNSALPTAVFDRCDAMVETQLAEAAEAMLARLQGPDANAPAALDEDREQRIEVVSRDEMQRVPALLGSTEPPPALEDGAGAEYLTVLADACGTGHAAAIGGATTLLRRDFGLADDGSRSLPSLLTDALAQALIDGRIDPSALTARCAQLAATLATGAATPTAPSADRGDP